jgi:hypothetical protein
MYKTLYIKKRSKTNYFYQSEDGEQSKKLSQELNVSILESLNPQDVSWQILLVTPKL